MGQKTDRLNRAETDLFTVKAFAVSLLQQNTLDDLLWSMAENLSKLLGFESCRLFLLEGSRLVEAATHRLSPEGDSVSPPCSPRGDSLSRSTPRPLKEPLIYALGEGTAGTAAEIGEAVFTHDVGPAGDGSVLSDLAVPIIFEEKILGIIYAESDTASTFGERERDRLGALANIAASRLASALADRERQRAEDALQKAHDDLELRVAERTAQISEALAQLEKEMAERHRIEQDLAREKEREKRREEEARKASKLESLGILAGGIAHDFNNLLTVILGNVNLAQRFVEPGSREARVLAASHDGCLRARDLTKQLLTFASGGAPIKKPGSIAEVLRDSIEFALHGSNVRAELDIASDLHTVEMDIGQIHSVLNSLVLNADQAMPGGGVIWVRAKNGVEETAPAGGAADGVIVELEDEGCGIPDENLERIFDPYFTTKGDQGTGLGLTTAYKIVREHGGSLGVRSQMGVGTTFEIRLPAVPADAEVEREAVSRPPAERPSGHILLMDDDESVRSSVAAMLMHLGHQVTTARHGEEAIRLYQEAYTRSEPFAAVILDLTIPGGMGGKDVIPRLREIEPGVKAIVASGYSNDPVMAEHEQHGFRAVIEKPFDLTELDQVLGALIAS